MRIVHYYARFLTHDSGVTASIEAWTRALTALGHHDIEVWCAKPKSSREVPRGLTVNEIAHTGSDRRSWLPWGLFGKLRGVDVLYLHEGWVASNLLAAVVARLYRTTVVLMPHGVYEPDIVEDIKRQGPFLFRLALERYTIFLCSAIHLFYPSESELLPRLHRCCFAVPNGAPQNSYAWRGGGGYYLFIGRLAVDHKGLDRLLETWAKLRTRPRLRIVGPDYKGGRARLESQVRELGLADKISIENAVEGDMKWELLVCADAYLHPSRWESCSIMLLESLSTGVPSIVSDEIHAAHSISSDVIVKTDFSRVEGLEGSFERVSRDGLALASRSVEWARLEASWEACAAELHERLLHLIGAGQHSLAEDSVE